MMRFIYIPMILLGTCLSASDKENVLSLPPKELNVIVRSRAMPELPETRVGKILSRYYKEGLGGTENWDKIVSLNVIGKIKTQQGVLELNAYQKKPNYMKLNLFAEAAQNGLVLAYDGKVAWKQESSRAKPELMTDKEARRFIHSAHFGNYLLHPFAEGKRIRFIDTVPVEGTICHQIRVNLDTDYQVDYYIDIRSYLEIKVVNTDLRTGKVNSIIYKDYIRESGMPIAKKVESREDGKWVSSLVLEEWKLNSGVMPWMFHLPE